MGRVVVKPISGRSTIINVHSFDATTARDLKELVQDREGIPPECQRLFFALPNQLRELLEDGATLASYGVGEGATIHLVLQPRRPSVFVPPPPTSPVPWSSSDEWERFMQGPWAELVRLFPEDADEDEGEGDSAGIRLLRAPTETDSSLLAVVEGPAGSCYQGGKFVVHVQARGPLQIRVLTPLCHPGVNTSGEVALIDGNGKFLTHHHPRLLSADRDIALALRTLRAQLLLTFVNPDQTLLLKERGAMQMIRMWCMEPRRTERLARALTALCAMTDLERRTSSRTWLGSFVSRCPQAYAEAKALLLVTARHPVTGEPRHPEAGLIATDMPVELIHLVVHHLALAHVPAERARLLDLYDFSVPA